MIFASARRLFGTMRTNSAEVELKSEFIPASSFLDVNKHMIFLHGLLGRGRNWRSIALDRRINGTRHCHLLDLRNHGESDHHPSMTYKEMAEDVIRYADYRNLDRFTLLGHSMGGKTCMTLSTLFPDRIDGVIVVDAPPKSALRNMRYGTQTDELLKRLKKFLDVKSMSRSKVMSLLSTNFRNEKAFVGLVSQNLGYTKHPQLPGTYWTCNMDGIYSNLDRIFDFEAYGVYPGDDVQLILGGNSYKYEPEAFKTVFPKLNDKNIVIVPGAGHWVHAEKPEETVVAISDFLLYLDCTPKYQYSTVTSSK